VWLKKFRALAGMILRQLLFTKSVVHQSDVAQLFLRKAAYIVHINRKGGDCNGCNYHHRFVLIGFGRLGHQKGPQAGNV